MSFNACFRHEKAAPSSNNTLKTRLAAPKQSVVEGLTVTVKVLSVMLPHKRRVLYVFNKQCISLRRGGGFIHDGGGFLLCWTAVNCFVEVLIIYLACSKLTVSSY